MPLSGGLGTGHQIHLAVSPHAQAYLLARCADRDLDIVGQPDASQQPLRLGLRTPRSKACPVGRLQHPLHVAGKVATVVAQAHGIGERKLGSLRQIDASQGNTVHAHLQRSHVQQALHDVDCLRPAGTAVGCDRCGIGQHRRGAQMHRRHAIHGGQHRARIGHRDIGHGMRADVAVPVHRIANNMTLGIEGQRGMRERVTSLIVAEKTFTAIGRPLHRPPQTACRPHQQQVFDIRIVTRPEATASVIGQHTQLLGRQLQRSGQAHVQAMHALTTGDQRTQAAGGIEITNGAARLHLGIDDALIEKAVTHHMRRPGNGCLGLGGITVSL